MVEGLRRMHLDRYGASGAGVRHICRGPTSRLVMMGVWLRVGNQMRSAHVRAVACGAGVLPMIISEAFLLGAGAKATGPAITTRTGRGH